MKCIKYKRAMNTNENKIKGILEAKGITLDVLAKRMGLNSAQAAYYRAYRAKKLSTIKAIAKALRVKINDIM